MSSVLLNERNAHTESIASRHAEYRPSGGRPKTVALSTYLERQAAASDSVEIRENYAAGIRDEQSLVKEPEAMLDESWTLMSGFRISRGETDLLANGPFGVCAMKIKNYQGLISVGGARWTRNAYHRYGNPSDLNIPESI